MLKVKLPDGKVLEVAASARLKDVAEKIGPRLAKAAIAGEVNGRIVGLDYLLEREPAGEIGVRILTERDPESLDVMRHSCAHVMARAVMRLYESVQLAFGPTIENGFYYDFGLDRSIAEEDFATIEAEMAKIIADDEPFERIEEPREQALAICSDLAPDTEGRAHQHGPGRPHDPVVLSAGRVHRPVPRAARAQRRPHRRLQAALGRRRLLEGRRSRSSSFSGCMPPRSSPRRISTST